MATLFNMDTSEVENEILKLQNDIQIKSMATGGSFWNLLSKEKYPSVRKCSMYLTAFLVQPTSVNQNTDQHCQMNTWMPA